MDLRPLELAVPYQLDLDTAFAPWLDVLAELNDVSRAALDTLDCRFHLVPNVVQYNLYCDGSYTPQVHATTKRQGADQKAGWFFVIVARITPRAEDEVIVGIVAVPLMQKQMDQHSFQVQSAETFEVFALHQAVEWALSQSRPVTIFYDCAVASEPAAGKSTPSEDTKRIARATRALVH